MSLKHAASRADHRSMRRAHADQSGYTLIELLVAAFVLVVGMAGAFALLNGANSTTVTNNARMGATNLARELLEDARSVDYEALTPTEIAGVLQAKMGVTGSPSPWIVARRGIKFTVTVDVCTFDDPKDALAATAPVNVCTPQAPVPAAAGTLEPDVNGDDFRRVTVNLAWNTGRGDKTSKLVSLINNPSGGLGPRIISFPNFDMQVTGGESATINATSTTAGSLRWNSDGTPNGAGDATGGPTAWQAIWQLGPAAQGKDPMTANWSTTQYTAGSTVLDGTYTITGQAFDDRGIAGDSRASVLPLNRSAPITVTGFEVGRNFNTGRLEFRWNQSPELDIVGYRVLDLGPDNVIGNGNDDEICETERVEETSCSGSTAMPPGNATYGVVALDWPTITAPGPTADDKRRSNFAEGVASSSTEPASPSLLTALPDLSLKPVLNWSHPSAGSIRFFRIYRITGTSGSCCAVADRYDVTSGNGTSWTDPNPPATGEAVRYWVTAVGPGLNESTPTNAASWVGL
jgi:prepilin-type N-terminal cleavage/methylation domain-containing protein